MCSLAPDDYSNTTITVTFRDGGPTLVTVPIPIVGDELRENSEYFNLSLSTLDTAITLGPVSSVKIDDDDREFILHIYTHIVYRILIA